MADSASMHEPIRLRHDRLAMNIDLNVRGEIAGAAARSELSQLNNRIEAGAWDGGLSFMMRWGWGAGLKGWIGGWRRRVTASQRPVLVEVARGAGTG